VRFRAPLQPTLLLFWSSVDTVVDYPALCFLLYYDWKVQKFCDWLVQFSIIANVGRKALRARATLFLPTKVNCML
jgi:hypothetical protein